MARTRGIIPNGRKARRYRIEAGLTVVELAARIGCNRQTIYQLETNRRPTSEIFIVKLAMALGVKPPDILADPGEWERRMAS